MWVPQYHGGWAMVIAPPLVGIAAQPAVSTRTAWAQYSLFFLWFIGYFLFYCATVWLRSRMKKRYLPPVQVYAAAVCLLGFITVLLAPFLWRWAILYAPLMTFAAWTAWKRKERSLASGLDTTLAACLLIPMMYDVGSAGAHGFTATPDIWVMTALYFGYFAGTVFYVKTNIRERGSQSYFFASVLWHLCWTILAIAVAYSNKIDVSWPHVFIWVILSARAAIVPMYAKYRGIPVRAHYIGVGEIITCALFVVTLH